MHFSYYRIHLAALHFNENSTNKHAMTKTGQLKYRICYPKSKKGEEAVVKPQKEGPTYGKCFVMHWCSMINVIYTNIMYMYVNVAR